MDIAKEFLDKLIIPSVEEAGLLIKGQITFWKFMNQVKILKKAKEYCEKNDISVKAISLKVLCPLLDHAALEEKEVLQNKRAILLSNMVDSEQNIENHVFPYLLSQMSSSEYAVLNSTVINERNRKMALEKKLTDFTEKHGPIELSLIHI